MAMNVHGSVEVVSLAAQVEANRVEFARKVRDSVLTSLMPEMYKYLTKKDANGDIALRVPVAIAITRLLQALDEAALHKELPKLVVKVTMSCGVGTADLIFQGLMRFMVRKGDILVTVTSPLANYVRTGCGSA